MSKRVIIVGAVALGPKVACRLRRLDPDAEITVKEAAPFIEKYKDKWMNIPQDQLRDRLDKVPFDRLLCLVCGTGARSYECQVLLNQKGFDNVCNVQGGHAMILAVAPDFIDS